MYLEGGGDVLLARCGQDSHELLERVERLADVEVERHLVDVLEI